MMRVLMTPGAPTPFGTPEQLFDGSSFALGGRGEFARRHRRTYDVSPDGRRFLMIKSAPTPAQPAAPDRVVIVQNWFEELKAKLPQD